MANMNHDDRDVFPKDVDRTGWPKGPWDNEPDKVQWTTAVGYDALIVRNRLGALCGYVGVPKGHQAYGRTWESSDNYERDEDGKLDYERRKPNPVDTLSVHGGITYADRCDEANGICHVPAPGQPDDAWWLGFDCLHAGDAAPGMMARRMSFAGYTYRDLAWVRAEVEDLARQLRALVP